MPWPGRTKQELPEIPTRPTEGWLPCSVGRMQPQARGCLIEALGSDCSEVCPDKEAEISSLTRLLSIVWRALSARNISPCRLRPQWHFPALSCHRISVGAVTAESDSLPCLCLSGGEGAAGQV